MSLRGMSVCSSCCNCAYDGDHHLYIQWLQTFEPVEDGTKTFTFPGDTPLARKIKVVGVKGPAPEDDLEFAVDEVEACKEGRTI